MPSIAELLPTLAQIISMAPPVKEAIVVRTIPHCELRKNSSAILEEVRRGETIHVTSHGVVVATLVPPDARQAVAAELSGVAVAHAGQRRKGASEANTDICTAAYDRMHAYHAQPL